MSNVRENMMAQIRRKEKKIKEHRANTSKSMSYKKVVLKFIEAIEQAHKTSLDSIDFNFALDKAVSFLESRMSSLDPGANLTIVWHKSESEDWKDLFASGVTIKWSEEYLKNNPESEKETCVDVSHLFMEGDLED